MAKTPSQPPKKSAFLPFVFPGDIPKGWPAPDKLDLMPLTALCALRNLVRASTSTKSLKGTTPDTRQALLDYLILVEAATIEARDQDKSPRAIRKVKYSK